MEPWLIPIGYAESGRLNGVEFKMNTQVVGAKFNGHSWALQTEKTSISSSGRSQPGQALVIDFKILCLNHLLHLFGNVLMTVFVFVVFIIIFLLLPY